MKTKKIGKEERICRVMKIYYTDLYDKRYH